MGLLAEKNFSCGKVFEVFVVRDDVNWSSGAFEVMTLDFKSVKNG